MSFVESRIVLFVVAVLAVVAVGGGGKGTETDEKSPWELLVLLAWIWIVILLIGYWTGLNPGLDSGGCSVLVQYPSKEEHLQTVQSKHE